MPKIKQKPLFTYPADQFSSSSVSDGKLITESLILNHGYDLNRFSLLSRREKDYIESTLCVIIQQLCDHLEKLSSVS